MYRFLLSRRWAIITLIALLLIPAMIRLGFWQLHRHESRVARNALVARSLGAPPVAFDSLSSPGWSVPAGTVWRSVTAVGRYDPAHEFVVRQRTDSGGQRIGYYVVTPLRLADGRGTVLVNRGWVEPPDDGTAYPSVPAAPAGDVTVSGRLRADETAAGSGIRDRSGLPPRQFMLINSEQQAKADGDQVLGGYLELVSSVPAASPAPEPVPEPNHTDIGPHMAYAVQWWLFAAMVPVGFWVLARREARDLADEAARARAGSQAEDPLPA